MPLVLHMPKLIEQLSVMVTLRLHKDSERFCKRSPQTLAQNKGVL